MQAIKFGFEVNEMKALLVIDVQDSYMKRYEPNLLEQINKCIKNAYNNQYNIIYVKNTKRLRSGSVTEKLADGLDVISDLVFCKEQANAFTSEEIIMDLQSKNISEVEIIGIDGNSCVAASAKGAAKMGFHTTINLDCVGVSNLQRFETTKEQLLKLGVVLR